MSTEAERKAYLKEHLRYELLMMRHTFGKISAGLPQLDWNACFESFAVHARNLYLFLTNDKDARNFKASDFAGSFIAKKDEVVGKVNRLNASVAHLSKNRVTDSADKVSLQDATLIKSWVENNFRLFLNALSEAYRIEWDETAANPAAIGMHLSVTGPTGPTGSPLPTVTNTACDNSSLFVSSPQVRPGKR